MERRAQYGQNTWRCSDCGVVFSYDEESPTRLPVGPGAPGGERGYSDPICWNCFAEGGGY